MAHFTKGNRRWRIDLCEVKKFQMWSLGEKHGQCHSEKDGRGQGPVPLAVTLLVLKLACVREWPKLQRSHAIVLVQRREGLVHPVLHCSVYRKNSL